MREEKSAKSKRRTLIACITVFCVLYIIFALKPLGSELHLTPEWTIDMNSVSSVEEDEELIPFRLGQNMGYFTRDGKISSCMTFPFKSAISKNYYASYGATSNSVDFYSPRGEKCGTINEYGFPFFEEDRIYVFLPGGSSFVECNGDGERLWLYEHYAPVTAFSSSNGGTVAGFADGKIVSFYPDGKVNQQFVPGGSAVSVILGVDISRDGEKIAAVSGQKPQRIVVAEKNGSHSRVIFHENIDSPCAGQVKVRFSLSGKTVFYDTKDSLGIVDLSNENHPKSYSVPLKGVVSQIEESKENSLVYILSRDSGEYTVTVLEPYDHVVSSFTFKAHNAFIQVRGNALFVGKDNKISCLTVLRR